MLEKEVVEKVERLDALMTEVLKVLSLHNEALNVLQGIVDTLGRRVPELLKMQEEKR